MNAIFTKENQAALRSEYANGLAEVWKKDGKMIDYCLNEVAYFIPLSNGIVTITKERIEKEFWFGYSDCGQGLSYDECNETMDAFNRHKEEAFFNRNLRSVNGYIEQLKDEEIKVFSRLHYYGETEGNPVRGIEYRTMYDIIAPEFTPLTKEERALLIEAYKLYKEDYKKRLNTYYKRYSTKIRTRSYWVDR